MGWTCFCFKLGMQSHRGTLLHSSPSPTPAQFIHNALAGQFMMCCQLMQRDGQCSSVDIALQWPLAPRGGPGGSLCWGEPGRCAECITTITLLAEPGFCQGSGKGLDTRLHKLGI